MSLPPTASLCWLSTHPNSVPSSLASGLAGSLALQPDRQPSVAFPNTAPPPHSSLQKPLPRRMAPTSLNFEWPNLRISAAESNPELPQPAPPRPPTLTQSRLRKPHYLLGSMRSPACRGNPQIGLGEQAG